MRLARPIYEALPAAYLVIGAFALHLSYVDVPGARATLAFVIGAAASIAALTLQLRRRDERERRREYSVERIDAPGAAGS